MSAFAKGAVAQATAIREGIKIVRNVFAKHDVSKGLSTAEVYQLALREPAPKGYKGDPQLINQPGGIKIVTPPPQNDHPIRSKVFLKRTILPTLAGSQEIVKVVTNKEIAAPIPVLKKGKKAMKRAAPESAETSPTTPVTIKAWVWKPVTEEIRRAQTQRAMDNRGDHHQSPEEDWSHLNKRRQNSRKEKEHKRRGS